MENGGITVRNANYLEFIFVGEPQPGTRYILACKNPDGSAATVGEDDTLSAVERVRRVVEGQFNGWLDGAVKIPFEKAGVLRLLKDGEAIVDGPESEILAACERDEDFPLDAESLLGLPANTRRYQIAHVVAGDGKIVPADDMLV